MRKARFQVPFTPAILYPEILEAVTMKYALVAERQGLMYMGCLGLAPTVATTPVHITLGNDYWQLDILLMSRRRWNATREGVSVQYRPSIPLPDLIKGLTDALAFCDMGRRV
ncbi:hypothetical protein ACEPPN_004086 [Leptodophora sp. 'Broadleaf-Isolate-01']